MKIIFLLSYSCFMYRSLNVDAKSIDLPQDTKTSLPQMFFQRRRKDSLSKTLPQMFFSHKKDYKDLPIPTVFFSRGKGDESLPRMGDSVALPQMFFSKDSVSFLPPFHHKDLSQLFSNKKELPKMFFDNIDSAALPRMFFSKDLPQMFFHSDAFLPSLHRKDLPQMFFQKKDSTGLPQMFFSKDLPQMLFQSLPRRIHLQRKHILRNKEDEIPIGLAKEVDNLLNSDFPMYDSDFINFPDYLMVNGRGETDKKKEFPHFKRRLSSIPFSPIKEKTLLDRIHLERKHIPKTNKV